MTGGPSAAGDDALLRHLAEQAPAVLWTTDRDLRLTSAIGAALRHLGVAPGRIKGLSLYEYFRTRDPRFPPIAHHLKALDGEKGSYEIELRGRAYQAFVEPFRDGRGEVVGALGMALDITERKRAESALQDSEARWKAVVTQAPDFIFILDVEGRIFYINRTTPAFTAEEVMGASTLDFLPPAERAVARAAYRRAALTGKTVTYDVTGYVDRKGTLGWFRNRVGRLSGEGQDASLILVATDITGIKRAEAAQKDAFERMRRLAARLQSVREEERQRIARDIHDRLGQELTGVKLDLSSLAGRLGKDAEGRRRLKAVFGALDGLIHTVREISTGLRPPVLDSLGLRDAVEWQAREFGGRTGLRLRLRLPSRLPRPDPERATAVFRIFQEVLTNVARHARARNVDVSLKADARGLSLTVADDGRGISRAALEDPSSLGLLGMRERAAALGGAVDVRRGRAGGTVVAVRVPLPPRPKRRKT